MATDVKEITVDSSSTDILKSLTPAEHKSWRETGEIPERKPAEASKTEKSDEKAETSPAAKTEVVEKPAESAPAEKTETPKPAKGAEARIKELLAKTKELETELANVRKQSETSVPAKKQEEIAKPRRNDVDEKGQPKYATDEEFLDARDEYVAKMASQQTRADIAKEESQRRAAEQDKFLKAKWENSLKIAIEAHPDFSKVCEIDDKGAFQNAELKKIKGGGALDRFCLDTQRGGDVLYYLASHPGEVERIQAINSLDEITEALVELKKKSLGSVTSSSVVKTATEESGKGKSVSKAPSPAAEVGGKATAAIDEAQAALDRGDFREYKRLEDEKEWRSKKKAS